MQFIATADTDVGKSKEKNQDSVLIKHGIFQKKEVIMAIICDGMGGFAKGELGSATVIKEFNRWFEEELPFELRHLDMQVIGGKWSLMLKNLNVIILEYGQEQGLQIGTTFSGILIVDRQYVITHVGDTRIYYINKNIKQLTTDQTFVAREIERGVMTKEQAKTDKRRNLLLQCVGASQIVEPEVIIGECKKGVYMICSDGFRHEITEQEMYEELKPANLVNKNVMHARIGYLINLVKDRDEKDNISAVLIKAN